ncbi:hypothetical protein ES332_D13G088400v1 [Gossypium tomentosum]|uniref:RNase H type-1 domain-containing protein n=1 Tax=Gossypium tomentosum TaxID=34277 RepID=A0A5D2HUN7_GOSTO|nr:hypothetical protein ES332_D13G088400v1 [Gossypium tomentosum]
MGVPDVVNLKVDWWGQPKHCKSGKKLGRDSDCVWDPPPTGWLKFNMAGVVFEEVVGCGGVLRDEKGVVFALFCGKCGVCGVEQVVVMAIKVATEIFIVLMRKVNVPLIVEFELSSVSNWLKYRCLQPWSVRKLFANIERGLRHLVEIKLVVTNTQKNGMANSLENVGLFRNQFFKAY